MGNAVSRVAIVTGVGMGIGGIGRGIAEALAREQVSLMLSDVDPRVAEVATALRERFPQIRIEACAGDLSTRAGAAALVEQTMAAYGQIDILVNNAGSGIIKPFLEHDEASFTTTLARNL